MPVPVAAGELLPELPLGTIPGGQAELAVDGLELSELEDELPGTQLLLLAPLSDDEPELPLPMAPELGAFVDGEVLRPVPVELLPVPKLEPPDVVPPVCAKAAVPSESATIDAAVSSTRFI